jgi:oxygen-dependent protoporphyrinogen oxidase
MSVVVVGAGISGLAAAHVLHERGIPVTVLEAAARVGGVIDTRRVEGALIEGGPDAILTQKPEAVALCREVGLGDRLVPTNPKQRAVYVLRGGRLLPLPEGFMLAVPTKIRAFLKSPLFTWAGKVRMGLEVVVPARKSGPEESISAFLTRRFGAEAALVLGEPLLAGIHSGDPDRLSMEANYPRFVELEHRRGSLIRGLWHATPQRSTSTSAFVSLQEGLAELPRTLAARLPDVRLGARATGLRRAGGGWTVELADGSEVEARAVVLALPSWASAPLVEPHAPEAARELSAVRWVSTATVALAFRRDDVGHPLDGYGLVAGAGEGLRTSACSFVSTKFPGRAPEGQVLLRGFLGGARDEKALDLTDAEMVATVCRDMTAPLGLRAEPLWSRVARWPRGTPQMEVGHRSLVGRLEQALEALPGVAVCGSGLRGTGLPDCVAEGRRAAEGVAARLG